MKENEKSVKEETIDERIKAIEAELFGVNIRKDSLESELANLRWQNASQVIAKMD